ncbi:MAG: septum site-determining protein MinC [Anaerolineae bacterium]|nr:septum site-determining protein MinC [Anaerolineae bacterium]
MANERIVIKGTSDGLIITVGPGAWPGLMDELEQHLGQKASFFKGGRVALRVGPRQLSRPQLEQVGRILSRHNVSLWAVESDSPGTRQAAAQAGLETETGTRPTPPAGTETSRPTGDSIVIQRTLRSGQVVHHPGHVVIIGDINPGAEVRAGGNVVVWGRLRGTVHAGAGDEGLGDQAIVCALQLAPTQLRIGSHITRSPANEGPVDSLPEVASVQGDQIVAEVWK